MQPSLSTKTKISYGIGDFGLALTSAMIGLLFAKFLSDTVGLPLSLVAGAVFLGRTWDWVNDPIQGYISDHIETRWGRRRPFLLFGAIPFGLFFAALWWIPPIESKSLLAVYYTIILVLFDTMVTVIFIPYVALTPEISDNYDDRTSLTGYRMFFSLAGSLLGTVLPLLVLGGASIPPEKKHVIFIVAAVLATLSSIPFLITFAGTTERPEHTKIEQPGWKEILSSIKNNRPYVLSVIIYTLTNCGFETLIGANLFFMQYKLRMPQIAGYTTLTMFLVALASIPLWLFVSRSLDKAKGYMAAMAYLTAILALYSTLNHQAPTWLPFIFAGLAGIGVAAGQILPWAMLPDTIEYAEYISGKRNEGVHYSFMTLARKVSSSVVMPVLLLILARSGYIPNATIQATGAINAITVIFGGIPAGLFLLGMVSAVAYPLSRRKFNEIKTDLETRKKQGNK